MVLSNPCKNVIQPQKEPQSTGWEPLCFSLLPLSPLFLSLSLQSPTPQPMTFRQHILYPCAHIRHDLVAALRRQVLSFPHLYPWQFRCRICHHQPDTCMLSPLITHGGHGSEVWHKWLTAKEAPYLQENRQLEGRDRALWGISLPPRNLHTAWPALEKASDKVFSFILQVLPWSMLSPPPVIAADQFSNRKHYAKYA